MPGVFDTIDPRRPGSGPFFNPGANVILSGDANGPSDNNAVTSVTDDNTEQVPIGDLQGDTADRFVVRGGTPGSDGELETISIAEAAALIGSGQTEFDFIITDRASLVAVVAPVGGVFNLPTGSYAFKQALTLNPGERLSNNGNSVLLQSMGPTKRISGDTLTAPLLTITGGTVQLIGLALDSNTSDQPALRQTGGVVEAWGVSLQGGATSDGLQLQGGEWYSTDGEFVGGAAGIRQSGASATQYCSIKGGRAQGDFSDACFVGEGAGNVVEAHVTLNMSNSNSASNCVLLNGATSGDFYFSDCTAQHSANNQTLFQVTDVSTFVMKGGNLFSTAGTPGDGVQFSGTIGGGFIIDDVTFLDLDECIREASLTDVERATIANCDVGGTSGTGINWDSGDIPSHGMMILGCNFGPATPFVGFNENSARVNVKCCSDNTGLIGETSIVP